MTFRVALAIALLLPLPVVASDINPLVGLWETEDQDGVVELYQCKDRFCGRFYWLKEDSAENPSRDDRNPDIEKRKRPLCGLMFMGGFSEVGKGRYENGWIYSPHHGSMFSAELHFIDPNSLSLRGYVFLPFLGGSQVWRRLDASPKCPIIANKNSS